jgi:hypothetical protein
MSLNPPLPYKISSIFGGFITALVKEVILISVSLLLKEAAGTSSG